MGENCFIQNYVDHDTTPAAHDYTCHDATYDGHDGTDIRLRNLAAMRAGITVKAVADGTVLGTRNNVADVSLRDANAPDIKDRECGNGVRLQHAEGFVTQYCHMQKGSIRVVTGQPVKAGDALGLVGLSGETEFPHLHLGVWKDNVKMDPFTADSITSACNAKAGAPQLWATPIPYQSTALLNDGMTGMAPTKERMQDRPVSQSELPANGPAIIYWVEVMALQKGDVLTLAIASPDGSVFAKKTITLDGSKAEYFGFLGRKNSSGSFAQGLYHPSITVMRDGQPALHVERELAVQ